MPLSADPLAVAPYVLKSDRDKPEASRPAFLCRFLTRREKAAYQRLIEKADSVQGEELWRVLWDAILLGVMAWENMQDALKQKGLPPTSGFTRDAAEAILTEAEIMELALAYPEAVSVTEHDRKNSSAPRSAMPEGAAQEETANAAKTDGGTAPSAPPSVSPPGTPTDPAASAAG